MKLTETEEELYKLILEKKGLSKSKWEKEQLEEATVKFLAEFTNSKSPVKKAWNNETLSKAKRDLINQETINLLNNKGE